MRYESGLDLATLSTVVAGNAITTVASGACTVAGAALGATTGLVIINGNPSANPECG